MLADHWNYHPCAHGVILTRETSFDVIHDIGKSLKTKGKHDSNRGIGNYPMPRITLWHKRLSFLAEVNKTS